MSTVLASNQYGKSKIRLVKVERHGARHELTDINVDISLAGEFLAAYDKGDNSPVLPTDTMKNTVYALARKQPIGEIEEFGIRLAEHFLKNSPQAGQASISISQNNWKRIDLNGQPHDHAFLNAGGGKRTAWIETTRAGISVKAGVSDLFVLKTTKSAFEGYVRDEYTTLKPTKDRLFGTAVRAEWVYGAGKHNYGALFEKTRDLLLKVFACHDSLGVQHTLYEMGNTVLKEVAEIEEIFISMPNKHCLLIDLSPFGMDNPNEVFVPTDEPHGLIEGTLRRS